MSISIDSALPPVLPGQTGPLKPSEDTQVHQLKAQGQDVTQIAVDLSLTSATVGNDLLIDIPKYPVQTAAQPAAGSAISVRV